MLDCSPLIIGSGRVATHLGHYLRLKGIPFKNWSRSSSQPLAEASATSSCIFLAIRDDAIESLARQLSGKELIHFSGSVFVEGALGLHPLMTFGKTLYDLDFYDQIPLVLDQKNLELEWLTKLPNKKFYIQPEQKSLYHGLCHLAGNYPKFLWLEIAKIFEGQLDISADALKPFLGQILEQSFSKDSDPLTGAFGRRDLGTIDSHLKALSDISHLKKSYEGFLASYTEVHHDHS